MIATDHERLTAIEACFREGGCIQTDDALFLIALARRGASRAVLGDLEVEVTIRRAGCVLDAPVDHLFFGGSSWNQICGDVLAWLRIEILPFWRAGSLDLVWWASSDDPELAASMGTIARLLEAV